MGDVRERPAVNERGIVLQRLHEIRCESVSQQGRHRALRAEFPGGDGLAVTAVAGHDPAEPVLEFAQILRQAEDRHDFRSAGDIEAGLPGHAVGGSAQTDRDVAQRAVVHVDHPAPGDAPRVHGRIAAPVNVVVNQRGEQIVRGADSVKVPGEVQVDIGHRHDLRVAAASTPRPSCRNTDPDSVRAGRSPLSCRCG